MTAVTLRRCPSCGAHSPSDAFAGASCRSCARPQEVASVRVTPRRRRRKKPPTAALEAAVLEGRASWHRCTGRDVHSAHKAAHRAGFWTGGHLAVAFVEECCVYPDGPRQGEPATLIPWQRELLFDLFALREDDARRRYRRALVGVAKKNAKTTLAAWLGLYFLIADTEPTPLIMCAAANDDQADLVFGAARATCEFSSQLAPLTERWEKEIRVPSKPGARLRRVAAGGGNLDGPNVYVSILDELHEWRTQKNRTTSSSRARIASRNSMLSRGCSTGSRGKP